MSDERRALGNGDAGARLLAQAEEIDRPRGIDHRVEFLREETALRFADHVIAKNYGVRAVRVAEGRWRVDFHRVDELRDIDAVVLDLLRDARDFGGVYEGWGCEAVGPDLPTAPCGGGSVRQPSACFTA